VGDVSESLSEEAMDWLREMDWEPSRGLSMLDVEKLSTLGEFFVEKTFWLAMPLVLSLERSLGIDIPPPTLLPMETLPTALELCTRPPPGPSGTTDACRREKESLFLCSWVCSWFAEGWLEAPDELAWLPEESSYGGTYTPCSLR
jgi:hypothetical protein